MLEKLQHSHLNNTTILFIQIIQSAKIQDIITLSLNARQVWIVIYAK